MIKLGIMCCSLGMRGSTPLDVAAASCIDNNELALALQEQDLEMVKYNRYVQNKHCAKLFIMELHLSFQVVKYLAGCGLQSCPMLLSKGYPDIGWNPCGGEKYLDFLRFAVFVNGQIFYLLHNAIFNYNAHNVFSPLLLDNALFFPFCRRERRRECQCGGTSPHSQA